MIFGFTSDSICILYSIVLFLNATPYIELLLSDNCLSATKAIDWNSPVENKNNGIGDKKTKIIAVFFIKFKRYLVSINFKIENKEIHYFLKYLI